MKQVLPIVLIALTGVVGYWFASQYGPWRGADADLNAVDLSIERPCVLFPTGCKAVAAGDVFSLRFDQPPQSLKPFKVVLALDAPLPVEHAVVQFEMVGMDMGINRFRLSKRAEGTWVASAVLPVCSTGRSDWVVRLTFVSEGERYVGEFPFETR